MGEIHAKLTNPDNNIFSDLIEKINGKFHRFIDLWSIDLHKWLGEYVFDEVEKQFHDNYLTEDPHLSDEELRARDELSEVVDETREALESLQKNVTELKTKCDSN